LIANSTYSLAKFRGCKKAFGCDAGLEICRPLSFRSSVRIKSGMEWEVLDIEIGGNVVGLGNRGF